MNLQTSKLAMIGMCLATFLGWLDLTIVNTALPNIQIYFQVNDSVLQWVMNALLLSLAAFMVIVGKLADRYGRRRLLYLGLLLLALSSIGAALSESFLSLVIARLFQGIAIGIIYTAPLALVSRISPEQIPKAMGYMIGTGGFALALGPVFGGVLVHLFSWHAIFWLNLPICLFAWLFCIIGHLPEAKEGLAEKVDLLGSVLLASMLIILIFTTVNIHQAPLGNTLLQYVVIIIIAILFVRHENRITSPIINFQLFVNRHFIIGVLANFFLAFFYCVDLFFIPLHLNKLGYHSPLTIGLILLPPSLMFAVLSLFSNRIASALGPRKILLWGFGIFTLSALLQIVLGHSANLGLLLIPYLLLGVGWAFILATAFAIALTSLPNEMGGVGMGSVGTFHNFGGTVGLALGSTLGYFGAMTLICSVSIFAFAAIFLGLSSVRKSNTIDTI